jgi:microcystin-dependent protein
MAEPFLSEIRIMSFSFPPKGWAFCNGQFLPINQNQALFSLLGTTYGGNGQTTFALPNLQGRVPLHMGKGYTLGQAGGETAHTLTMGEMTAHNHFLNASNTQGDSVNPSFSGTGYILAQDPGNIYGPAQNLTTLNPGSVSNVGGSQAHENMQPYLSLNFCIALQGIFPSQN